MGDIEHNFRIKVKNTVHPVEDRISAKYRMWDFMNDIKMHVIEWKDTEEDLAEQLITTSLGILYPHFTALEVERELRNIYTTLNREIPKGFVALFTVCFEGHILAKLRNTK